MHVTIDLSSPEKPSHKPETHSANLTIDLSSPETEKRLALLVDTMEQKGSKLEEALIDTTVRADDELVNDNLEDTPEKSEVVDEEPEFTITHLFRSIISHTRQNPRQNANQEAQAWGFVEMIAS
jgi:hypothetical protein